MYIYPKNGLMFEISVTVIQHLAKQRRKPKEKNHFKRYRK